MTEPNNSLLKIKKDALISALFALSKASQELSNATVDFYNEVTGTGAQLPSSLNDLSSILANAGNELALGQGVDLDSFTVPPSVPAPIKEEVAKPKRVSKKKDVDPNAPKKPVTAFFLYSNANREAVQKELSAQKAANGELYNVKDLSVELGQRWHQLTPEQQNEWKARYQVAIGIYNEEKKIYEESKHALEANGGIPPLPTTSVSTPSSKKVSAPESVAKAPSTSSKKKRKAVNEPPSLIATTPLAASVTESPIISPSKRVKKDKKRRKSEANPE